MLCFRGMHDTNMAAAVADVAPVAEVPTPGCTSNPDIHMKISLHTRTCIDRSTWAHKSTYIYTYIRYTHVYVSIFAHLHILCIYMYIHIFI